MLEVAIVAGLVAYNNGLNLWRPFNGWLFVPLNLLAACGLTTLAVVFGAVPLRDVTGGFGVADAGLGLLAGACATAPLFVIAASKWRRFVADDRVAGLRGRALAYQALVRIPLGTALFEEVAFRGILLALFSDRGRVGAAVISSAVFACWHVSPTLNAVRANVERPRVGQLMGAVAGAMLFTFAAGLLLCRFRFAGGILLPFAVHASVNSLATVAATRAGRPR